MTTPHPHPESGTSPVASERREIIRLIDYVSRHVERGECKCGRCSDAGNRPDPDGHTADLVFFKVAKRGEPTREEFERLTKGHRGEFCDCDPFDGNEHNYIELGGWIGDQGLAMQYMGLGSLVGAFRLMTPKTMGFPDDLVMQMAELGLVSVLKAQ